MAIDLIDTLRCHLLAPPGLAKFAIVMAGIVVAPATARRLRIPGLVGLLAFGVLLGPYVLAVAGADRPIAQFFAELGKLMLMFYAGLEIHFDLFRQAQTRCLTFGLITTIVPQALGTACGLAFGYPFIPAVVVDSLLASHTLISLPIVTSLGRCHHGVGHLVAYHLRDLRFNLRDRLFAIRPSTADH
jgi:Kef-type K+ transport system membrane component KefB